MALTQSNSHAFQSGELVTATKLNNVKVVQTDTATNNNSFTGSAGQLTYDTTNNKLRVHDGSTAGGTELFQGSATTSFDTDAYQGVTQSRSGIGADPTDIDIFTVKTGRIRFINFDIKFNNNGAYPSMNTSTTSGNKTTISLQIKPPTGKSFDIYNLGDITSDTGDGSHFPYGSMRYSTYDNQTLSFSTFRDRSDGFITLRDVDNTLSAVDQITIFLDDDNDGRVLHSIRGSVIFPTSS